MEANIADFDLLVQKTHDQAKEGLRFFGMTYIKRVKFCMLRFLKAI